MIRTSHIALLLLSGLLALPAHAGKVFKWVDERGITHFSSRPPILHGDTEVIDVPDEPDELMVSDSTDSDEIAPSEDKQTVTPEIAQFCQQLTENLTALATDDEVRLEFEDGSFEILGKKGKEREKERIREQLAKHCQP